MSLVEAVKAHALAHYEDGGWDVIVECFDDAEILDRITEAGAVTESDAIKAFDFMVDFYADRQADAINSAF